MRTWIVGVWALVGAFGCSSSSVSFENGDAAVDDTASPSDSAVDTGPCPPGQSEKSTCGKCGSRVRVCGSNGKWSDFSSCSGEGVCTAGATESEACTGGGARKRTCSASCTWGTFGACEGTPSPCGTVGATEVRGCGRCGTQTRTCLATGWSDYGTCGAEGVCAAGSTETSACPDGGTKTRTCTATCTWDAFGACTGAACASGSVQQTFDGTAGAGMWGCAGTVAWSEGSKLCGAGRHLCTADEFTTRRAGLAPNHHYWVKDYLAGSGSETACRASKSTSSNFCPANAPMRACAATKYDGSGNYCTWVACGYESTTTGRVFGGCNDDGKGAGLRAGAVCCD